MSTSTGTVTGRIAEITAPRTFTVRPEQFPAPPPGQVLIRVLRVGICAGELPDWQAGPADGAPPLRIGHEPVGHVHAVGDGVHGLSVGQTVTGRVEPSLADYVYADPVDLVPVPDGVDDSEAVGEPLGCVVEGYRRSQPAPGARTAVIGLGFMGLVMTRLLAMSPTSSVWAVDPRTDARDAATTSGATRALAPDEVALTDAEFDLVVEATGTQAGLDLASALTAERAVLSILGYHQAPGRDVDMRAWNWKALDVVNAHIRDRNRLADSTRAALRLLASGRLRVADMLTHRYPLERSGQAFEALENKPPGFVKAVIDLT
ncbi:alcohol dehydrogenase catalytic domain-containing protein [Streptomyces winkii]|uniref:alcohol dehydrogenase catalytic domain-containing protein n=1 Tax=Streptomyces winkii TaxID=3051178 RepID=UPI0028D02FD4|nr:alcohol dehydrogenase catalytic domain-containing protein [Streptomyces sp. DSM 40971]